MNLSALYVKEQLVKCFVDLAEEASYQRHMDGALSASRAGELKAQAFLFREARDLVESVCANGSALDFEREVQRAFARKRAESDWGWGSNWPDHVHTAVLGKIYDMVQNFFRKEI